MKFTPGASFVALALLVATSSAMRQTVRTDSETAATVNELEGLETNMTPRQDQCCCLRGVNMYSIRAACSWNDPEKRHARFVPGLGREPRGSRQMLNLEHGKDDHGWKGDITGTDTAYALQRKKGYTKPESLVCMQDPDADLQFSKCANTKWGETIKGGVVEDIDETFYSKSTGYKARTYFKRWDPLPKSAKPNFGLTYDFDPAYDELCYAVACLELGMQCPVPNKEGFEEQYAKYRSDRNIVFNTQKDKYKMTYWEVENYKRLFAPSTCLTNKKDADPVNKDGSTYSRWQSNKDSNYKLHLEHYSLVGWKCPSSADLNLQECGGSESTCETNYRLYGRRDGESRCLPKPEPLE